MNKMARRRAARFDLNDFVCYRMAKGPRYVQVGYPTINPQNAAQTLRSEPGAVPLYNGIWLQNRQSV
jgi:hypothetical protein